MGQWVYRDAPIKVPAKKKAQVLPEMRKLWKKINFLDERFGDVYYRCRTAFARVDKVEQNEILKEMTEPYLKKKDGDLEYVFRSWQYILARAMAEVECGSEEPLRKFETIYYMTYLDLGSAANFQGYFALRTRLRRYEYVETTAYSPLYLYVYELLNLVGVKDEHEALKRLIWLREHYRAQQDSEDMYSADLAYERRNRREYETMWAQRSFARNLGRWIWEFGWYYGCDDEIPEGVEDWLGSWGGEEKGNLWATVVEKLVRIDELSDEELVENVLSLAGGGLARSLLRREHKDIFDGVIVKLYREMDAQARKRHGKSWVEKNTKRRPWYRDTQSFFANATFFPEEHENKSIGREPIEMQTMKICFAKQLGRAKAGAYNVVMIFTEYPMQKLFAMVKYVDFLLRAKIRFRARVKEPEIKVNDAKRVTRVVEEFLEQKRQEQLAARREAAQRKRQERLDAVKIDHEAVEGIRSDAEVTRDSLLVEDELEEKIEIEPKKVDFEIEREAETNVETGEKTIQETGLTAGEQEALRKLIAGGKCEMSSLEVDEINNKLYDLIGDNVLEFDNNGVILYNDYIEDVKRLLS